MNNVELFPCYSIPLMKWLSKKGIKYKIIGLHPKTKKMFYVFIDSQNLKSALQEWKKTKPIA